MTNYRRHYQEGGTYYFTVAIQNRETQLLTENINILRQSFRLTKLELPFQQKAFVIMPDHIHAIWKLPSNDSDFSTRWKRIKSRFSAQLPTLTNKTSLLKKGEKGIWQRRFWEHYIQSEEELEALTNYIHNNPIKHGWTERAEDWAYSSIHYYASKAM